MRATLFRKRETELNNIGYGEPFLLSEDGDEVYIRCAFFRSGAPQLDVEKVITEAAEKLGLFFAVSIADTDHNGSGSKVGKLILLSPKTEVIPLALKTGAIFKYK